MVKTTAADCGSQFFGHSFLLVWDWIPIWLELHLDHAKIDSSMTHAHGFGYLVKEA